MKNCQLNQFLETFNVTSYSSGRKKDVVNQCLKCGPVYILV